ncbi:MAG TPA: hypothetical protein VFT50_07230 [Baekduia sp.]|nr:hypothetical protein [Baekduia sp.]
MAQQLDDLSDAVRVIHALPGRVRLRAPALAGDGLARAAAGLERTPGVVRARAGRHTGSVLVEFDPARTGPQELAARLATLTDGPPAFALDRSRATAVSPAPRSRVAAAAEVLLLGLDLALLVARRGRGPGAAAGNPWLSLAMALARALLERRRAAPAQRGPLGLAGA